MGAKRDDQGRLLCVRPGCLKLRTSARECDEHWAMTYATQQNNISRREPWQAPWRRAGRS